MQVNIPLYPLMWIFGIVVTLFSVAGITAFMNSASTPIDDRNNLTRAKSTTKTSNTVEAKCADCDQIKSVPGIVTHGEGTSHSVVNGRVVDGAVGNPTNASRGKEFTTVGGAVTSIDIENQAKSTKNFGITFRLDDGSSRRLDEANAPMWYTGDQVEVTNGTIQSAR